MLKSFLSAMESQIRTTMCRLCLCCDDSVSSIFEDKASDQYNIASLIRELLQFKVSENDDYPKQICTACVKTITDFKKFKNDCIEAMTTYGTDKRLHKKRSIRQKLQEKKCSSKDKEETSPIQRPDKIKKRTKVAQVGKNLADYFKETIVEEIPIETLDADDVHSVGCTSVQLPSLTEKSYHLRIEELEGVTSTENTMHNTCSEVTANHVVLGDEDVPKASTSVTLEKCNQKEGSIRRCVQRDGKQEDCVGKKDENPGCKCICYICDICGKVAATKQNIACHLRVHSGAKPYKCKICKKSFSQHSNLKTHEKIHIGVRSFKCKNCHKTFPRQSHLVDHEKRHLSEKNYRCDQCLKSFINKSELKKHQLYHKGELRFFCSVCGKGFVMNSDLTKHIRIHTGIKPFKCPLCSASFNQTTQLKKHYVKHMKVKPFTCVFCKKFFQSSIELENHNCTGNNELNILIVNSVSTSVD